MSEEEKIKCEICGEEFDPDEIVFITPDGEYEYPYGTDGLAICEYCLEGEESYPVARVTIGYKGYKLPVLTLYEHFYFVAEDDIPSDIYDEVMPIIHEIADELHEAIRWVHVDPWRGYYDISSDKLSKWVLVADDCILAGSDDARELEKFDEELRKISEDLGLVWARAILTTSNLFSAGYYFLVKKVKDPLKTLALMAKVPELKAKYRDWNRFVITALTGKTRVEEFDEKDRYIVEFANRVFVKGENPEEVFKDIEKKIRGGK